MRKEPRVGKRQIHALTARRRLAAKPSRCNPACTSGHDMKSCPGATRLSSARRGSGVLRSADG